jgi:hypothetical protein
MNSYSTAMEGEIRCAAVDLGCCDWQAIRREVQELRRLGYDLDLQELPPSGSRRGFILEGERAAIEYMQRWVESLDTLWRIPRRPPPRQKTRPPE